MFVGGGTKIGCSLLICQVIFATCSPFRSGTQDLEISPQLSNCNNVIYFPSVEYPVLDANKLTFGNGCSNTQIYGPFRPKNVVTCSNEEDESYKDPKWWKMFADKLKGSNKATETSNVATKKTNSDNSIAVTKETKNISDNTTPNTGTASSQQAFIGQSSTPSSILTKESSYKDLGSSGDVTTTRQTPDIAALTNNLENLQNLPLLSRQIQNPSSTSIEPESNLTPLSTKFTNISELLPITGGSLESLSSTPNSSPDLVSTEMLESLLTVSSLNMDQNLLSTSADASPLAENNLLNTLEDVNTVGDQNSLSPLDSVASAITNLILNPTSVQKRTPTNDTSISEKASFVWMAIPYLDENSTASVIPLVVLKFPPVVINNSLADNSTIEKIVVDSLKKQDVQDIISATKIKEALLNKTISVVDYYQPLSDNYDSILELTNRTEAKPTTDNTFAFFVDKSNSTSLLIDKIKNEVIKSKEVKPDSIAFYVNDLEQNSADKTTNNTKISKSLNVDKEDSAKRSTGSENNAKDAIEPESGEYFKTIVIKIIRKSDNSADLKQLDIENVNYKTDNLVIQIIDEQTAD